MRSPHDRLARVKAKGLRKFDGLDSSHARYDLQRFFGKSQNRLADLIHFEVATLESCHRGHGKAANENDK
jgi:hypothetical protein